MSSYFVAVYRTLIVSLLLSAVVLLAGCGRLDRILTSEPTPPRTATPGRALGTIVPMGVPTHPMSTPTPDMVTLTLWATEAIGPVGQTPGSRKLSAQIAAFEAANLGVRVDVVLKKPYGKGGMLDYLTTTAAAAPAALPDVVILDIRELKAAARRQLIQPIDGRVTPELAQDLVAPARAAGQVDNVWLGLPFVADVQHLIYNTSRVVQPPMTWTDVLSGTEQYLFPAGGQTEVAGQSGIVNNSFITQYFAAGARLTGDDGRPVLDRDVVAAILQFYADGLATGLIPKNAVQYSSLGSTWPTYLAEDVGLADVSAHRYLENRGNFQKSSFGPIPTQNGALAGIFEAWAYVLVATDPERQDLAWDFIEWLTSPDRLGEWALAADYLPTRLSALPDPSGDQYLEFLAELLQNSRVRPVGPGHDEVGRALQQAVQAVFAGAATPAEAAAEAAASVP